MCGLFEILPTQQRAKRMKGETMAKASAGTVEKGIRVRQHIAVVASGARP
jgi:hypothetical protein